VGEEQKKTTLTLFFPGEYRFTDAKEKDKPVPYKKDFMKEERKKRGKEQIPLLVKIDSQQRITELGEKYSERKCNWFGAKSIFRSCGVEKFKGIDPSQPFNYKAFYPSYGVSVSKKCSYKEQATAVAMSIFSAYQAKNPGLSIDNSSNSEKPIWQIYSMPIAWIQSDDEQIPHVEEYGGGIIVFSKHPSITKKCDVEYVILLCIMLLSYSSNVIWKMKRELSANAKKPVKGTDLQKIHDSCALFLNLYYCPNPCHSKAELKLFEDLREKLRLENVSKQMINAKELLDYRNELNLSTKSASIDNTVFITGYIGVLFALLSFCNIYGTDIVDFSKPVTSGWCYFFLAGLICATFCFLVKIFSIIRSCIESIRKRSLIIGCILLMSVFAICFVLFADPIGIFKIANQ